MITQQSHERRHSDAGRCSTARTASRFRRAFLAVLSLIALVYAAASMPAAAQTQVPAPAPAADPAADPAQKGPDIERIKDWSLQCPEPKSDKPRACFLIHDVFPTNAKTPILQIVVTHFGKDKVLGGVIFVPLGVRLPPGLLLQIDQGEPQKLAIERCTSRGCQAEVTLTEPLLASLKAGAGGEVTFDDGTGRQVVVPFSLQGFSAGLSKLP